MPKAAAKKYRIGYQNPWSNAAENQAFHSMRIAAERVGHELIEVVTSNDIERANLDFVIATAVTQAKLTDVPTFGSIHAPRQTYCNNRPFFENLLSYDGYLTISETLERFLQAVLAGFGRKCETGKYYNTPQLLDLQCDIASLAKKGAMRLCYFGTNWEERARPLFRELSGRDYMRIYGPQAAWDYLGGKSYCGSPPFDGESVQYEYCMHGIGLVSLSRSHLLDDVISNRVFEIASVSAVAICPDTPWIRTYFGDSVYYYNALGTTAEAIADIDDAMQEIAANPREATKRAARANAIFREKFCAEVMLANAVTYFETWRDNRKQWPVATGPMIDVIVRVGGRPLEMVRRALQSIDGQTRGQFRIILVKYRKFDADPLINARWKRITHFETVDCLGGNRSKTLCAGLKQAQSPLMAILDDDDFWLNHHIDGLLDSVEQKQFSAIFAYSGIIAELDQVMTPCDEPRSIYKLIPEKGGAWAALGQLSVNCFLFSTDLLEYIDLDGWTLETAEDSVLEANLMARANVSSSFRPTACFVRNSPDGSKFLDSSTRLEDEFEFEARSARLGLAIEQKLAIPDLDIWERLRAAFARLQTARNSLLFGSRERLALEGGAPRDSVHDIPGITMSEVNLEAVGITLSGSSELVETAAGSQLAILPPVLPWAYGAVIHWREPDGVSAAKWVVVECDVALDSFGLGLLDVNGSFVVRAECPKLHRPVEIWLPIPPEGAGALVIQNWTDILLAPTIIRRIWLVHDL